MFEIKKHANLLAYRFVETSRKLQDCTPDELAAAFEQALEAVGVSIYYTPATLYLFSICLKCKEGGKWVFPEYASVTKSGWRMPLHLIQEKKLLEFTVLTNDERATLQPPPFSGDCPTSQLGNFFINISTFKFYYVTKDAAAIYWQSNRENLAVIREMSKGVALPAIGEAIAQAVAPELDRVLEPSICPPEKLRLFISTNNEKLRPSISNLTAEFRTWLPMRLATIIQTNIAADF